MPDLASLAFDMAPVGICLTEDRIIRAVNESFARMTGHDANLLPGQSFRIFYDSDRAFDGIRDVGLDPLRDGRDFTDERLLRHATGRAILVRFRARTLTPDRPLARLVMTFAPLTDTTQDRHLTPRERTVIAGLTRGRTSKEIARDLGLSPRTVEDVRARLLRRFGVRNAAELLARLSGPAF
ncbi:PAS and helix-turn-helix domain-containing protein [Pseudooceanicola onchidii]|uniref:PAS and helix-turn-helix domain-containing protein n=1 Tax=Pseudooceanicola onchidii TaxID=2562279 RepID=UPI0010AA9BCD|nr:PAS and helix-turn-helix domain-containing protein [Pseudooceanicola onchidii]